MATVTELANRQRVSGTSGTREYIIAGSSDLDDARTQLLVDAPATWETGGRTLKIQADECEVYESSEGAIYGVARYSPALDDLAAGTTAFSFDTGGGTQRLMRSISTTAYGTTPPATQSLIGVTKDSVEGVDIIAPVFNYQVTKRYAILDVTQAYIAAIFAATGTVNSAAFTVTTDDGISFSFAAGENLYLGGSGGVVDGEVEITHKFSASQNATGLSVGGISDIAKKGWEYLWVLWEDTVSNSFLIKKARAVYVEQVYRTLSHGSALTP